MLPNGTFWDCYESLPGNIRLKIGAMVLDGTPAPSIAYFVTQPRTLPGTQYFWALNAGVWAQSTNVDIVADSELIIDFAAPVVAGDFLAIFPLPKGLIAEIPLDFGGARMKIGS